MPIRLAALVSALVWVWTLQAPVLLTFVEYFPKLHLPVTTSTTSGREVLLFGWLAPMSLAHTDGDSMPAGYGPFLPYMGLGGVSLASVAWYANPLWAWNIVRMFMARAPRLVPAFAASLLAIVGVQPFYDGWSDDHGVNGATIPLAGAYVWAAAVMVPFAVALAQLTRRAWKCGGAGAPLLPLSTRRADRKVGSFD